MTETLRGYKNLIEAQQESPKIATAWTPSVEDTKLKIEFISEGLKLPFNMAFLDTNDILGLDTDKDTVQRILN